MHTKQLCMFVCVGCITKLKDNKCLNRKNVIIHNETQNVKYFFINILILLLV